MNINSFEEKNQKKLLLGFNFFGPFWRSNLIFSRTVHLNEFRFLALQSVHQDAPFELSNGSDEKDCDGKTNTATRKGTG